MQAASVRWMISVFKRRESSATREGFALVVLHKSVSFLERAAGTKEYRARNVE
jgi:hypothetical protein